MNSEREGFAFLSAFPFLAAFSSVFHTPKLGCCIKSNNLRNGQYFFLLGLLTPSTSGIQIRQKNFTVEIGYHYTNSSQLRMICPYGLMNFTESINNRATATAKYFGNPTYDLRYLGCILYHLLFCSPPCNFDCKQINSLLYVLIYHCFHFFAMFIHLPLVFLSFMLIILVLLNIVKNCERIIN